MTTIEAEPPDRGRIARAARGWWPLPAAIAAAVIAQEVLLVSRYDVGGHAGEHIGSATAPFMATAVLYILFWATPAARRQVDALLSAAAWFAATVLVMIGNLRVVNDLIDTGHAFTPTSRIPDVADHSLANSAPYLGVVTALLLVASFRWRRHIGNQATAGAAVACVLFPPWLIPGAGVVVLAIVRCVARGRARGRDRERAPRELVSDGGAASPSR